MDRHTLSRSARERAASTRSLAVMAGGSITCGLTAVAPTRLVANPSSRFGRRRMRRPPRARGCDGGVGENEREVMAVSLKVVADLGADVRPRDQDDAAP